MNFAEYYHGQFRSDLNRFLMSIPTESRHHAYDKTLFTIQIERLMGDKPHILEVPEESRADFAVGLFWTILVDEVCYTHFRSSYDRFQRLTRYPKLIGSCPSGCRYHLHPQQIFNVMRSGSRTVKLNQASGNVDGVLRESVEVMKAEMLEFCQQHLPVVRGMDLWNHCAVELPIQARG